VKSTINGVPTYFAGTHYEVTDGVVTKYYYADSQRIATLAPHASAGVRKNTTLYFILCDHLGSTSLVTNASGLVVSQTQRTQGNDRYLIVVIRGLKEGETKGF